MTYHLRIKDQYDAFTCRSTGFRLNCFTPEGRTDTLSPDIKTVIRSGRVLDLNGKALEAMQAPKDKDGQLDLFTEEDATAPVAPEVKKDEVPEKAEEPDKAEPKPKAIEEMNKEELLAYIDENGLDAKKIGISTRMGATRIQEELLNYLAKGAE